jgi:radical SAM protein with 4Fe4S-binding SPASM domain
MAGTFSLFNIELTNHCVMKCVMCPRTGHMTRAQGYLDSAIYRRAIDELARCNPGFSRGNVLWLHHFGESLLHPECSSFIGYASERNIRTGLSINPYMLTPRVRDQLLWSRPGILYISLDGHDNASFAEIRGMPDAYDISKERLLEYLDEKRARGVDTVVILSMIDFGLNRRSIELTRASWEQVPGINCVLVKSYTSWDGSVPRINEMAGPAAGTVDRYSVRCTIPWDTMTVTWDGDVVPCCFDYDKKYVLGNLGRSTLSDIWKGDPLERLRNEFISNNVQNPLCKNCERLYMPKETIRW